jgi:RimJ/RimL family protein N-acetyltransferase
MLLNYETVIVGEKCVLVPYRPEHVIQYHSWMQDPALLEATASEPLSLEQEYEMQRTWRDDEAKCTFIVLARDLVPNECCSELLQKHSSEEFIQKSLSAMVGDVNMFLSEDEDETDDGQIDDEHITAHAASSSDRIKESYRQAELDIMIAEKEHRKRGVGQEAVELMMLYGATLCHLRRIFCKINQDNTASLQLFQSKLGFRQCAYAECFREVELEFKSKSPEQLGETLVGKGIGPLQTVHCPAECSDT